MSVESPDQRPPAESTQPLSYQSPPAQPKSQWITDDQPGGRWVVGCLMIAGVAGLVVGGLAGLLWLFLGW